MKPYRNILAAAALAFTAASSVFAAPVAYQEAAAPWNLQQALRLAPALTPDVIKDFEAGHGPAAAAQLAAKQKNVSELLKRYSVCALKPEDQKTAGKYLSKEFQAEIKYYANGGCASLKAGEGAYKPAPGSASLEAVSALAASGALGTAEGSARFFDGYLKGGAAEVPAVRVGNTASAAAPAAYTARPAAAKALSAKVPKIQASSIEVLPLKPEGLGRDGMVNTAVDYWDVMRRENSEVIKKGELTGSEKNKAYLKMIVAAGLGGLLMYSNLSNVEIAAARVRWDIKNGAPKETLAIELGKFVFHSGVFVLALAPIPITKVINGAIVGEGWAIALLACMIAGPIDRYITHIADVKRIGK